MLTRWYDDFDIEAELLSDDYNPYANINKLLTLGASPDAVDPEMLNLRMCLLEFNHKTVKNDEWYDWLLVSKLAGGDRVSALRRALRPR